jgi:hypothetical protein
VSYEEDIDLTPFLNTSYAEAALADLGGEVAWD